MRMMGTTMIGLLLHGEDDDDNNKIILFFSSLDFVTDVRHMS